jgi:hypothetical protein
MAKKKAAITKTEAVRQAVAEGKEMPEDGIAWVKEQYGFDMTRQQFSVTKSNLKKTAGSSVAEKPFTATTAKASHSAIIPKPRSATVDDNGQPSISGQIAAIKQAVENLGADEVKKLSDLFG